MSAAVFVDRDGVINELVPDPISGLPESPLDEDSVALAPGAPEALRSLSEAGYVIVVVSNQPAAAKGLVDLDRLGQVQTRVCELLERRGAAVNAVRICFHHPEGIVPRLTRRCDCRKPAPGLLLAATEELGVDLGKSWMIGDTDGDVAAGAEAGCRTILIENPASAHKRSGAAEPDARVLDLAAAASLILGRERR